MPVDRFGRKRKDFANVSLGAEDSVVWEYMDSPAKALKLIQRLKKDGFQILAIEQAKESIDYRKIRFKDKTLLVLGNEVNGISNRLLKLSDAIAEIPMRGKKESLNVSVVAGIVLFR